MDAKPMTEIWTIREGACPHCGEVVIVEEDFGEEECCEFCGQDYIITGEED